MSDEIVEKLPDYWCGCCGRKMEAIPFHYRGDNRIKYCIQDGKRIKQKTERVYWECPSFWCRLKNGDDAKSYMLAVRDEDMPENKWRVYFDRSDE